MHDIIIIGGGIAGLSLAYRCMQSHKVLLIEQNDFFSGTTSQSLAGFSSSYSSGLFTPYLQECINFYTNLNPNIIKARGRLISSLLPAGHMKDPSYKDLITLSSVTDLTNYGFASETIEATKHLIDFNQFKTLYFEKNYFDLNIESIKNELLTALQACKKIALHPFETVLSIQKQHNLWQIKTALTTYRAPIVVNASGPWTTQLFKNQHVHLQREDCALIGFEALPEEVNTIPAITDDVMSFFIKPKLHQNNEFILASNITKKPINDLSTSSVPDNKAIEHMLDVLKQVIVPMPILRSTWVGIKTSTEDSLPLIGFDANKAGLFWYTGFAGYGNKLAPFFSQMAFDLINESSSIKNEIVNKLSPKRYSDSQEDPRIGC
ncbi:NAD(P)/FAD-dependent oxidoreductase [Legionella bononiensis]|uniref:FAD-binding oxidoreductase n=1 Tax=Legionella bononiensis TaxID=2793102 RepID=A0ABS1WFD1_9GAMM|nr:FAD-binding oxidoreductase [Legionella bononiensis]MBL7479223.1 FAD-binding oxidoreductase [Legionella bononiensis]MBL7528050.1 FAD-binding oxidoreductase [Legionella bononiensis]MBL7563873.1 FAD-binding oxidoreductase [Legionella bononiensis]